MKAETLGDHVSPADPDVKAHLANVVCTGEEVSLSECSYQKLNQSYYRSHSRDAGVICAGELAYMLALYTILMHNIRQTGAIEEI